MNGGKLSSVGSDPSQSSSCSVSRSRFSALSSNKVISQLREELAKVRQERLLLRTENERLSNTLDAKTKK